MGDQRWRDVKEILQDLVGIPNEVLDYIAVQEVLKLCASGRGNTAIARQLGLEVKVVSDIVKEFFNFDGWDDDLDINPWFLYRKDPYNQSGFEYRIRTLTKLIEDDIITLAYHACSVYGRILEEIEKYD